jgi:hypothetical protein
MRRKRPKVIFYYAAHFNSSESDNPYLSRLTGVLRRAEIEFILLEEPSKTGRFTSQPETLRVKFIYFIIILRKLLPIIFFNDFEQRERFIGRTLNVLTFGKYRADIYITLGNALGGVLRGLNPEARVIDYQHGIIPSGQPGYFTNGSAASWIKKNNKEVFVYGEAVRETFYNVDEEYYEGRVHVLGSTQEKRQVYLKGGNNILAALQIVESENKPAAWFQEQVDLLCSELHDFAEIALLEGVKVYLKHHPRSNRTYNLEKLFAFPFVYDYDEATNNKFCLMVTFFSTTAFEAAAVGIPTLFLYSDVLPEGQNIFTDEFNYPFSAVKSLKDWYEMLNNPILKQKVMSRLEDWYRDYYSEFNENLFLEFIYGKEEN